jgi:hypothetical protein
VEVSVNGADGNGGGYEWHTGGVDGCLACESTKDACNNTDAKGGLRWTVIGCTSDCNSLRLEKGNPKAMPKDCNSTLANKYICSLHTY